MSLGNSECSLGFGPFTLGSTEPSRTQTCLQATHDHRNLKFEFPRFSHFLFFTTSPLPHFPSRTMYEELHSSTATHINPAMLKLWLCHPYSFFSRSSEGGLTPDAFFFLEVV
ncbi:hypothetical protein ACB094_06G006300 [Castanea mollissima]